MWFNWLQPTYDIFYSLSSFIWHHSKDTYLLTAAGSTAVWEDAKFNFFSGIRLAWRKIKEKAKITHRKVVFNQPNPPQAVNPITLFSRGPHSQVTWPNVYSSTPLLLLQNYPLILSPSWPSPTYHSVPGGSRPVWCGQEKKMLHRRGPLIRKTRE